MFPSEVVDISGMAMAALPENIPEARVLVVDDETNIVELLSVSLKFQGFEVHTASNGPAALDKAREVRPDAVILDVMMPGMDGFGLLRRLRADGIDAPALFLTARDTLQDKIAGLTLGGDDYVTKPFSLEEVVARLRVILRRTGRGIEEPRNARLTFADIELDEDTHEVWKAGEPVSLSPTEFTLLRYFIINAGTVLSQAEDPRPRVALRLRRRRQRRRVLRLLPAPQDRHRREAAAAHAARRRLRPATMSARDDSAADLANNRGRGAHCADEAFPCGSGWWPPPWCWWPAACSRRASRSPRSCATA